MASSRSSFFTRTHLIAPAALAFSALHLHASPWEDVSVGMFNEAHQSFHEAAANASETERRALRFGEAVSLLNVQPRTSSNIDKAYGILEEIRAASPTDDLGVESRYYQARIEQIHRATPDIAKAEAIYSELIQNHGAHPFGQRALVKLALIRLHAVVDAEERRRRFDEFAAHAEGLADVSAKVQMHLLLGDVAQRFRYDHEIELAHRLAAIEAGVVKRSLQIEVLVRIGDLARLTGKNDLARTYYARFLELFPRTDRRSTIERYLAELK